MTGCICDEFTFPPDTIIAAGLPSLPRQTGTFADFRRASLRAASVRSNMGGLDSNALWAQRYLTEGDRNALVTSLDSLGNWRGRQPEDFGIMLLEMWAYVCDITSFYDQLLANESYIGTAIRRESIAGLVDLLGYVPRPAIAALADIVAFADGRQSLTVPAGTQFRSGAFGANPPQLFELGADTIVQPLFNSFVAPPITNAGYYAPSSASSQTSSTPLICKAGSVGVKKGDIVLVKVNNDTITPSSVTDVSDVIVSGQKYTQVTLSSGFSAKASTTSIELLKAASTAALWTQNDPVTLKDGTKSKVVGNSSVILASFDARIQSGDDVIISKKLGSISHATIDTAAAVFVQIMPDTSIAGSSPATTIPAIYTQTTQLKFNSGVDLTGIDSNSSVRIYYSFVNAATIIIPVQSQVASTGPVTIPSSSDLPADGSMPGSVQLQDKNGLATSGTIDSSGNFTVDPNQSGTMLVPPINIFGNILSISRGETVSGEVLGVGDSTIPNQSFTLKKSPLTYLPSPSPTPGAPLGHATTLKIYVDGLLWSEAPSFYGLGKDNECYIVRQDSNANSIVTFGDGVLGRLLETGSQVTAYYRFGAGAASPPAGSITQIAKPVKGLKSVQSPLAAYGGADADSADDLRKYAPQSALLLGRAISLADLEAATAAYSGVRAVTAEWGWSPNQQVPAALIWYIADSDMTTLILQTLRGIAQPFTPIQVQQATQQTTGIGASLSIGFTCDPKRLQTDVQSAVRVALMDTKTGLLPPERLGIGKPLFRSQLFEAVLNVPGVTAITSMSFAKTFEWFWDFPIKPDPYAIKPDSGKYFDFTNTLYLNGSAT